IDSLNSFVILSMDKRSCLICTVLIDTAHLGVEVCRACAAFFKRSVLAGRKYTCRQGDKKCKFRKGEKFMCRSCRYDMCVKLGMTYQLPARRKARRKMQDISAIENPTSSSTTSVTALPSLIDRMEAAYKTSHDRRLRQEKDYVTKHQLELFNHHGEEIFQTNFTAYYDIFRMGIRDSTDILSNVFEDFDDLPIDHRVSLFKNFYNKFCMIECVYFTSKYFKNSKDMFMASLITFGNINNMDEWLIDETTIAKPEAFRASCRGFINDYLDLFGPMEKMGELTEREFHAVALLCYCDIETSLNLPEDIIENAREIRARVFNELQEYWRKEMQLDDFSQRLGNMMTLAHGAGVSSCFNYRLPMYITLANLGSRHFDERGNSNVLYNV
ncbi:hypothetical protein PMAYCL1PPCAC_15081, partial [Pristionchus mayeri]